MGDHYKRLAARRPWGTIRGGSNRAGVVLGALLALAVLALSACGGGSEPTPKNTNALTKTITSEGGNLQMKIPDSWREDESLNASADLQASNRVQEAYALVIADSKQDFGNRTLKDFAEIAKENFLKGITTPTLSEPRSLTINGKEAVRYQIDGTADNVKVTYLLTLMETESRYLQVIAWSLPEQLTKNRPVLESVTASVRELKPATPAAPPAPTAPAPESPAPATSPAA